MNGLTLRTAITFSVVVVSFVEVRNVHGEPVPGGTLDPTSIPKYREPLTIPPVMPKAPKNAQNNVAMIDYEIAARQISQQILPCGSPPQGSPCDFPETTVWAYGPANDPAKFNYPAFTIEARVGERVRVKWINDLVTPSPEREFLPHLFAVDQTLHWANPPGGIEGRDDFGTDPLPYVGPVPIVTHLHGGHTSEESDGYPEAWYLPNASNIPNGYATEGTFFGQIEAQGVSVEPGAAVFEYANDQKPTTLWYHDHALGITRLNVYAGLAGFYLLRGGKDDLPQGILPGPAPALRDPPNKRYYEIPIAIQDRSFNADGSLFYPDSREFFDGYAGPYIPDTVGTSEIQSDISPIWNPEVFFNTMVVNGKTWPYLEVEPRQYRFRLLNGCNSRFLILSLSADAMPEPFAAPLLPFWQIGAEGGFLPEPVMQDDLLMAPAERADVIVDFSTLAVGTKLYLINHGPDEPFGGGIPNFDFAPADPMTTGQVMEFRVIASKGPDHSKPPDQLRLPSREELGPSTNVRMLSLNEVDSETVCYDETETMGVLCSPEHPIPVGPRAALLGTFDVNGDPVPLFWGDTTTENIQLGATETWEIHNFTADAHPIHPHLVQFQVVDRQPFGGFPRDPEPWETGEKDTVIAYPGEITRVKARFDRPGQYVWHCHILEHEDNEMMRPFVVSGP